MTVHLLSVVIVQRTSMVEVEKNSALCMRVKNGPVDADVADPVSTVSVARRSGRTRSHEPQWFDCYELGYGISCDLVMCREFRGQPSDHCRGTEEAKCWARMGSGSSLQDGCIDAQPDLDPLGVTTRMESNR